MTMHGEAGRVDICKLMTTALNVMIVLALWRYALWLEADNPMVFVNGTEALLCPHCMFLKSPREDC